MRKFTRILNIEDDMGKHWAINRALDWNGCPVAEHAATAEEGIRMIEQAIAENKPYELLVTDMHFNCNGVNDTRAGLYVIKELENRKIKIPIILCSSVRYNIPTISGCIFYNPSQDLNWDFREILNRI